MKYLICILVLLFNADSMYAQARADSGCARYHKGTFTYMDSTGTVFTIRRLKHYQFDTDVLKDVWVQSRIKWISDCEYQLEQVGSNSKSERKNNHSVSATIITKALGPDEYEYTCGCKGVADSLKIKGIMRRIKNK